MIEELQLELHDIVQYSWTILLSFSNYLINHMHVQTVHALQVYPKEQETNSAAMAGLSTKKGAPRKAAPHILLLLGRLTGIE